MGLVRDRERHRKKDLKNPVKNPMYPAESAEPLSIMRNRLNEWRSVSVKRVLIVEDNRLMRSIMKKGLCDDGYEVITASNVIEAVSLLRDTGQKVPDFVFVDIPAPVPDSLDMVGRILRVGSGRPLILHLQAMGGDVNLITLAGTDTAHEFNDLARLKARLKALLSPDGKGRFSPKGYLN